MSRFFVSKESVRGNSITIGGKEAHHILEVMRLKVLDKVVAFDGTGKEYVGFIKEAKVNSLSVEVVQTRAPSRTAMPKVTLIQAIPKKEKMDYIVEKSTELGVHSIMPVVTKRTIPRWDDRKAAGNVERWRKIVKEASKQCGRVELPVIGNVRPFSDCLKDLSDYDLALMAALTDRTVRLKEALAGFNGGRLCIAIGPEGDFTPDEIKRAIEANFKLVTLGPLVLKSDTAGLAVLAILNYEFSNWDA